MSYMKEQFARIVASVKHLPRLHAIGGGIALIAIALIGGRVLLHAAPDSSGLAPSMTHVRVASVGELSSATGSLPVTGKVLSLAQATVLAQTSGEIVTLAHALGDYVGAGAIIASFENSAQRAGVLQAQGAYDAAQAALAKAIGSTAENSQTTSITALASAYAALDDAIHARADQLFTNPKTSSPDLVLTVPDSTLVAMLKRERVALEMALTDARSLATNTAPEDVTESGAAMLAHTQMVRAFLDNLIQAVNETPESQNVSAGTLAAYQTSLAAARTEVVGAMSSLTGAKVGYDSNDLATVQANLKQAQGALNAANSNLEKTIIRSSISGTIVSLPIRRGDYVSAFTQVAVVSNPHALYVEVQVTSDDAKTFAVGGKAVINGSTSGVITFIAPAIDPTTGKIEVKIVVEGGQSALTDGTVVSLALSRAAVSDKTPLAGGIAIPIVAVKMTPGGPVVFTVSVENTLVAHTIELGSILGDRVVVRSGLASDLSIVTDARGLSEGQRVVVE